MNIPIKNEILETIKQYNAISNLHIKKCFEFKTNSKNKLHKVLYGKIRKQFPNFPSALIQCARDNAIEMLKGNGYRKKTTKGLFSSIRLDLRTSKVFLESGEVQFTTVEGRKKYSVKVPKYFHKYLSWKVKGVVVCIHRRFYRIKVVVENGIIVPISNKEVLGIDLGIKNFVVCSDYTIVKSSEIRGIKRKYAYLRQKLQAIGTRSARRKLKRLSGGERRFMADYNHCLSKKIVEKPFGVFAMEELKNIRNGRKGRKFNRMRSNWTYFQLRQFIAYKSEDRGKRVILVDPRFTSLRCSRCGFVDKANRNKGFFHCKSCGFSHNADLNASFNMFQLGKASLDRLSVNQPIVATNEGNTRCIKSPDVSCKPPFLNGGS